MLKDAWEISIYLAYKTRQKTGHYVTDERELHLVSYLGNMNTQMLFKILFHKIRAERWEL